jgi:hypothetical protein
MAGGLEKYSGCRAFTCKRMRQSRSSISHVSYVDGVPPKFFSRRFIGR